MGNNTKAIIFTIFVLFILLLFVTNLKKPLKEIASLPTCKNGIILTDEMKLKIIKEADKRIIQGTGEDYFKKHFFFVKLDYDLDSCKFVVRYDYTYDTLHQPCTITVKAIDENNIVILDTHSILRPIEMNLNESAAEKIVKEKGIDYDYYNLVADIDSQTIYYKFYKEDPITGEKKLVFEIDAQSKNIIYMEKAKEELPIV